MSDEPDAPAAPADDADPNELVHVRYLDGTETVWPVLATRPRCCESHNQNPHEGEDVSMEFLDGESGQLRTVAVNPVTVVRQGDVFLIDRHSAQRADLEIVEPHSKPAAKKPAAKKEA